MAALKDRFAFVNEYVRARGGWVVSIPGAREVRIEMLPGSPLADELRAGGAEVTIDRQRMTLPPYRLHAECEGQRILPHAIVAMTLIEGSSSPVPITHAGIVTVERYAFNL